MSAEANETVTREEALVKILELLPEAGNEELEFILHALHGRRAILNYKVL